MAYTIIKLGDLLETDHGEDVFQDMAAKFSCPYDADLEYFLQQKAIEFEKHGFSRTSIVLSEYKDEHALVGYYALALKQWNVRHGIGISKSKIKTITGFKDKKTAPIFLIGQLSKNYYDGINHKKLIDGNTLLGFAFAEVLKANYLVGGRVVMVECHDVPALRKFYEDHGFVDCGCDPEPPGLVQYIRKLSDIAII